MSDTGGVVPYGYSQVADAVKLVGAMCPQELRQFVERLDALNSEHADKLFDALTALLLADVEENEPAAGTWTTVSTPIKAKIVGTMERPDFSVGYDEEDYYGVRLPAAAQ